MAPYRGRGRGARGGVTVGSGKLARKGIKTRAGYRRFDSQRVKDVDLPNQDPFALDKDDDVEKGGDGDSGYDEEDEASLKPTVNAYAALLQSFNPHEEPDERRRKKRKLDEDDSFSNSKGDNAVHGDNDFNLNDAHTFKEDDEGSEQKADEVDDDLVPDIENGAANKEDDADPFHLHIARPDSSDFSRRLGSVQANEWVIGTQSIPSVGICSRSIPKSATFALPSRVNSVDQLHLKKRLLETAQKHIGELDPLQQFVAQNIFAYTDLLLGNRTPGNAASLRRLCCLHALNHVLKGRDRILKNTARLAQAQDPEELELRDQGFTRPKVLILTETRQMASNFADCIVKFFDPEQQENKQRFQDAFKSPIDDDATNMPDDYQELFAGNNDNHFLTALKFTRKTVKFFSAFYASDIILASPLGLRRIIEHEDPKKRDCDFLSSIELVILDQADATYMQDFSHVDVVFQHLNRQVQNTHGADFGRIRHYYLDGLAQYLRQTLVFTAYVTPDILRLYNTHMRNVASKVKLTHEYTSAASALATTGGLGVKQTFSRFSSPSPTADPDARFAYFTTAVLPALLRLPVAQDGVRGVLIFIPSFFDFLRVRNYFASGGSTGSGVADIGFGAIHDYADPAAQRRARAHFLSGRHAVLLYTQRAHHFFRLKIRGVKRVVMYGVPDNPLFYEELVEGFLGTSLAEGKVAADEARVRLMFSKWEVLALERVVGTERVKTMMSGAGDTFDFV